MNQPQMRVLVFILCLTSKMSHDTSGRDSCGMTIFTLPFLFVHREVARGVTDRGVGSGALLGALLAPPQSRASQIEIAIIGPA